MFGARHTECTYETRYPAEVELAVIRQEQTQTKVLHEYRQQLEEDVRELEQRKLELMQQSARDSECLERFTLWGGLIIEDATENYANIRFLPHYKRKTNDTFTVSFIKCGPVWSVSHYNLPYCIMNFPQRVEQALIDNIEKLSSFIQCLQHEINLFVWRREQFKEAKSLVSPSVSIHPSVSTTEVHVSLSVHDKFDSGLNKVLIDLQYLNHQFLPHQLKFHFVGGNVDSWEELKHQLATLKYMPLKEAIFNAFSMDFLNSEMPISSDNTFFLPEQSRSLSPAHLSLPPPLVHNAHIAQVYPWDAQCSGYMGGPSQRPSPDLMRGPTRAIGPARGFTRGHTSGGRGQTQGRGRGFGRGRK